MCALVLMCMYARAFVRSCLCACVHVLGQSGALSVCRKPCWGAAMCEMVMLEPRRGSSMQALKRQLSTDRDPPVSRRRAVDRSQRAAWWAMQGREKEGARHVGVSSQTAHGHPCNKHDHIPGSMVCCASASASAGEERGRPFKVRSTGTTAHQRVGTGPVRSCTTVHDFLGLE